MQVYDLADLVDLLLSVCPRLIIIFCSSPYHLPDTQKQTRFGVSITFQHIIACHQHWQS